MTERTITVDASDVIAAFRRSGTVVLEYADQGLQQGAVLIEREAVRLAPKGEGWLARSIHQGRVTLLHYLIESRSAHGRFVEDGTGLQGPHKQASGLGMLPDRGVAAIAQWIRRKGITPRSPDVTPQQLPWLIARKIATDGTKAQPYMKPAVDTQEPRINELIRASVTRGLNASGFQVQ